jgi:hypothetical protein
MLPTKKNIGENSRARIGKIHHAMSIAGCLRRIDFVPNSANKRQSTLLAEGCATAHSFEMAESSEDGVHLVRVMTDDRQHQLWAAASARGEAVKQVLNAVPEGWTAVLLSNRLTPEEAEILNLNPG